MTLNQACFFGSMIVVCCIALRGHIRWVLKALAELEAKKRPEQDVSPATFKRSYSGRVIDVRSRPLIPVNKGYRAWFFYRLLNAMGMQNVSRFIWRRRRNAWLLRGFRTRFR